MTSAVGFTGTSVSALYQILAEKDQPDGYVGLDANGKIPVAYLPDEIPKDFTDVEIKTNKNQPNGYPGLDAGGQLAASVIPPGSYILSSDKGAVNGVAPLDGTGTIYFADLPVGTTSTSVAVGNHTHTGEFVLKSEVNQANGVPGLDGTSKVAIAQLPTGTAANDVALGNHGHAGQFEPVINPKRTAFNVDFGTGAGQAAEGNHNHDAGDITTGKIAFARLPVGAVASTVAEGDHTHNASALVSGTVPDARITGDYSFANLTLSGAIKTNTLQTPFNQLNFTHSETNLILNFNGAGNLFMRCSGNNSGTVLQTRDSVGTIQPGISVFYSGVDITPPVTATEIHVDNGASGTFTSNDGKTVTVIDGIVTSIV